MCICGGIWCTQISIDKWEVSTFTQRQLTQKTSLVSLKELDKVNNELIVKETNINESNEPFYSY